MPNFGTLFKLLQYVPMALEISRALHGRNAPTVEDEVQETRETLADFKKDMTQRLVALEEENAHLKMRIRDTDAALSLVKVLVWISGGVGLVGFVLALLALILVAHAH